MNCLKDLALTLDYVTIQATTEIELSVEPRPGTKRPVNIR